MNSFLTLVRERVPDVMSLSANKLDVPAMHMLVTYGMDETRPLDLMSNCRMSFM